MSTLHDVGEYFEGDELPQSHPWQDAKEKGLTSEENPNFKSPEAEEQFGYKKDNLVNNNKSQEKIKK